jgi:hypothetical protein
MITDGGRPNESWVRFGELEATWSLVATEGNLGAFVDSSGKLFLGHVQSFEWKGSSWPIIPVSR